MDEDQVIQDEGQEGSKMDKIVEFGKKYGGWIVGGIAAAGIAVAATLAMKSSNEEEYIEVTDTPTEE